MWRGCAVKPCWFPPWHTAHQRAPPSNLLDVHSWCGATCWTLRVANDMTIWSCVKLASRNMEEILISLSYQELLNTWWSLGSWTKANAATLKAALSECCRREFTWRESATWQFLRRGVLWLPHCEVVKLDERSASASTRFNQGMKTRKAMVYASAQYTSGAGTYPVEGCVTLMVRANGKDSDAGCNAGQC